TLNHTFEEIYYNCLNAESLKNQLLSSNAIAQIRDLPLHVLPKKYALADFLDFAKTENAFLFIGLHGDIGEDGTLQQMAEAHGIPYNGSNPYTSELCMDKFQTGLVIDAIRNPNIQSLPKKSFTTQELHQIGNFEHFWKDLISDLKAETLIIKPRNDGCSAGIVKLSSALDLKTYLYFLKQQLPSIPSHTFTDQPEIVELSLNPNAHFIFEPYIKTDAIYIEDNCIHYTPQSGWLELTVGVLEKGGEGGPGYHSLNPSITIASGSILSLEEKFQGGTGVNLTPPPSSIISEKQVDQIKQSIELVAQTLGINNYARIDIFFNILTEVMVVIEANTLPAMTPSTVIYHQALAETPPMAPTSFLENLVNNKLNSYRNKPECAIP
ncbi:MAG: hypothetical protein C5B43_01090, partial [Verrucomicrobia bacterium]